MAKLFFLVLLLSLTARADRIVDETLRVCNQVRAEHGLAPLLLDLKLCKVAGQHSQEMDRLGYFGHRSPVEEFVDLAARLRHEGCFQLTFAENIFRQEGLAPAQVARTAVKAWLESPVHRDNLLHPRFNRMGLGISRNPDGRYTLTQDFTYQAVEVTEKSVRQTPGGKIVCLRCQVNDGPRQGAILWEGKRQLTWQADAQGQFAVELELSGSGTLAIGQAVAEREWSIETELQL